MGSEAPGMPGMAGMAGAMASAQDQALLAQSVREAARTQQIMAGRIADELREVYRNLDLRPQIIPVPMPPQVMVPQPSGGPAWGGTAAVPPGLEIAGIPRYAREEELPLEPEEGQAEENWDEAFAALEPFPDGLEEEAPREGGQPGSLERRRGPPDRRVGVPERREPPAERREGPPDRREDSAERRKLKDYLAKVREKLAGTSTPVKEKSLTSPPTSSPASLPGSAPGVSLPEGPLALLEELGEYLPKRQPERRRKNAFMRSDARMKLDYLKSRLEGHKGIMQKIQESYAPSPPSAGSVSLQKVADAFIFIKDLAGYYPDRTVGTMMQSKVDSILRRIKR